MDIYTVPSSTLIEICSIILVEVIVKSYITSEYEVQVDDKYQYSCENKDNRVHGWISANPAIGFWMITPSNEFRTAGPTKQDLTSHAGPITLSVSTNMF